MGLAEKTLKELNNCEQSGAGVRIRPHLCFIYFVEFLDFSEKNG